jgi:hypothetical protein
MERGLWSMRRSFRIRHVAADVLRPCLSASFLTRRLYGRLPNVPPRGAYAVVLKPSWGSGWTGPAKSVLVVIPAKSRCRELLQLRAGILRVDLLRRATPLAQRRRVKVRSHTQLLLAMRILTQLRTERARAFHECMAECGFGEVRSDPLLRLGVREWAVLTILALTHGKIAAGLCLVELLLEQ